MPSISAHDISTQRPVATAGARAPASIKIRGMVASMRRRDIGPAWSKILRGHNSLLSLEITKECPFAVQAAMPTN